MKEEKKVDHHISEQGNKKAYCSNASSVPSTIREENSVFPHLKDSFSLNMSLQIQIAFIFLLCSKLPKETDSFWIKLGKSCFHKSFSERKILWHSLSTTGLINTVI